MNPMFTRSLGAAFASGAPAAIAMAEVFKKLRRLSKSLDMIGIPPSYLIPAALWGRFPTCPRLGRLETCPTGMLLPTQAVHRLETPLHGFQRRIGISFLLDDIPLDAAGGFRQPENLLEVHISFPDERLVVGWGIVLDVHGARAAGIAFQISGGIRAALPHAAQVELHSDILDRVVEDRVQRELAFHGQ